MSLKYAPGIAFTAIMIFGFGSPFLVSWHPKSVRTGPALFIEQLGDPNLTVADHYQASRKLIDAGMATFPYAIDALSDRRMFDPQTQVTVGGECENVLSALLNADPLLRYDRTIKNWPAWWKQNSYKSLAEIRAEVRKWESEHPKPLLD